MLKHPYIIFGAHMIDILFLEDDKLLAQSVVEELEDASLQCRFKRGMRLLIVVK